jgi:hypothetical protein
MIYLDRFTRKSFQAVNKMDKVKLIRMPQRSGLMRTRMAGVEAASAEVLTFLDSHVEATEGWLEPLMERIRLNPKAVPCPVIEEVNDKTFQYKAGNLFWGLIYEPFLSVSHGPFSLFCSLFNMSRPLIVV